MPNNPDPIPTLVNLSRQKFIFATANIPSTINASTFVDPMGEFFQILELEFPVKSFEKILQLATFFRQKDETLKMLYKRLLKLKEDTQSITNLEVTHWYLHSLEGILTLHAQVLQRIFVKFGNSYNLLNVYNIFQKLELAHAHYEASIMRPPSCSRPQLPLATPTRSSHSSRAKTMHLAAPILPSWNYCGNPTHKANECNIPSEDLFCDYYGKEGHQEVVCFAKFLEWKQLRLPWPNLLVFSAAPQPKAKAPQPSTQAFPTKGNSSKNVKKKEHNVDKREVLQAHAIQVQTLQNELESLRVQLANLKGKSSQPTSHAQPIHGSGSEEGPPKSFYGLSHDAMVGEYVMSSAHNSNLALEVATSFCPSFFAAQQASVAPGVFATRQVIQTDGLAFGSSPITRTRGARVVVP
jgi:hypothetical protein